jgi:hypothetical protein
MPPSRYRLTPSVIARHFKHRCDRLLRWDAVPTAARGKAGIGWDVPARVRAHSRPGIRRLMEGGDRFEVEQLQALREEHGVARVHVEGLEEVQGRTTVTPVPLARLGGCASSSSRTCRGCRGRSGCGARPRSGATGVPPLRGEAPGATGRAPGDTSPG